MDGLVSVVNVIIKSLQIGGVAFLALCLVLAGYNFLWGGRDGSEKAKDRIKNGIIGFILIMGASALASWFQSNITF